MPNHTAARRPPRVRDIDFSRPNKFSQDQQRRLERAHEGFCRTASTQLSAELRTPITFELVNSSQLTWSATLAEIPANSLFGIVDAQPIGTRILFAADLALVMRTIERLLGGSGTTQVARSQLTDIETALARRLFGTLLDPLSLARRELAELTLGLVEIETQASNVQLAPLSEPTFLLAFEARIDGTTSSLWLALPHRAIEPVADRIGSTQYREASDDPEAAGTAAAAVRSALAEVEVEVRAEAGALEMTIAEVLALRPGQVLPLGASERSGVTVYAGAHPLLRAKPGRSGGRRAVQVLERLREAP